MKIELQKFIHIEMHMIEAEKLKMILNEVATSDMPEWAKSKAVKISNDLHDAGVED